MIDLEYLFSLVLFYLEEEDKRRCDKGVTYVTITRSCDAKKIIEDSGTDDII